MPTISRKRHANDHRPAVASTSTAREWAGTVSGRDVQVGSHA